MRNRRPSAVRIPFAIVALLLALASLPLSAALTSASRPEEVGLSSERLLRIGEMVQRYIGANEITGAVTIVARKGKVAHYEAHGLMDLEGKTPMRKDAIFRMASMTKPVTAVSILMLVEEGKVRLTDPVSRFIPSFKQLQVAMPKGDPSGSIARGGRERAEPEIFTVPASREVTVRDLLTHTSGLQSGGTGARAAGRAAPRLKTDSLATHIPKLGAGPLDFQPGSEWRYSALAGMDTLGRIVEIASGLTYDRFLEQRLFGPLGMKDTSFVVPAEKRSRLVTLYDGENGKLTRTGTPGWLDTTTLFSGGGGLYSTAEDYIQFAQMLANDGEWNGKRVLSPRSVERMATNHVGDLYAKSGRTNGSAGQGFGLGVRVVMDRGAGTIALANGSFGWSGAFGTHFWVDRADQLAAILLIQEPVTAMRGDFENAVIQAIVE
jgi:CubicO group peptidase (beta-lactamase class C family)